MSTNFRATVAIKVATAPAISSCIPER
jgi:hypothetical protein